MTSQADRANYAREVLRRKYREDPEFQKKASERARRRMLEDTEYREKVIEGTRKWTKEHWADPANREAISKKYTEAWANNEERRKEVRERRKKAVQASWANPDAAPEARGFVTHAKKAQRLMAYYREWGLTSPTGVAVPDKELDILLSIFEH